MAESLSPAASGAGAAGDPKRDDAAGLTTQAVNHWISEVQKLRFGKSSSCPRNQSQVLRAEPNSKKRWKTLRMALATASSGSASISPSSSPQARPTRQTPSQLVDGLRDQAALAAQLGDPGADVELSGTTTEALPGAGPRCTEKLSSALTTSSMPHNAATAKPGLRRRAGWGAGSRPGSR